MQSAYVMRKHVCSGFLERTIRYSAAADNDGDENGEKEEAKTTTTTTTTKMISMEYHWISISKTITKAVHSLEI